MEKTISNNKIIAKKVIEIKKRKLEVRLIKINNNLIPRVKFVEEPQERVKQLIQKKKLNKNQLAEVKQFIIKLEKKKK